MSRETIIIDGLVARALMALIGWTPSREEYGYIMHKYFPEKEKIALDDVRQGTAEFQAWIDRARNSEIAGQNPSRVHLAADSQLGLDI